MLSLVTQLHKVGTEVQPTGRLDIAADGGIFLLHTE